MMSRILKAVFPLFWISYAALIHFTMGLRPEHIALTLIMLVAFFAHSRLRSLAIAAFPFAVFGILYDSLRLVPLAWRGPIHIRAPYQMESSLLQWLGLPTNFMLGDFFQQHHLLAVDIMTASAYCLHVIAPLGFAFWLWFKKSDYFSLFTGAFIVMNLAAFATYILYPAAPPWYVSQYGFESAGWNLNGSAAGLLHVDQWLGIPYFESTYARNSWNFGAIPSMHAAYPLLISLFARQMLGKMRWFFYGLTVLVAFSAVYLNHHYVIDLFIGWSFALATYLVFINLPQLVRSREPITTPDSLEGAPD